MAPHTRGEILARPARPGNGAQHAWLADLADGLFTVEAEAIATLDVRDFGAVRIAGSPRLLPRDLP